MSMLILLFLTYLTFKSYYYYKLSLPRATGRDDNFFFLNSSVARVGFVGGAGLGRQGNGPEKEPMNTGPIDVWAYHWLLQVD